MLELLCKNYIFISILQIGQTVLHMVSITGEPRLCALFLRANADPNLADDRQFRPIHWACMQGHKTVVRILLNHGTDVRLVNEVIIKSKHSHHSSRPLLLYNSAILLRSLED